VVVQKACRHRQWHALLTSSWFILLVAFTVVLAAADQVLQASVDRTELRQGESLQLTVTGEIKIDSAFSFFDLNTLNRPSPDTSELEKDFEVLDRQQNYKVEITNNVNRSVVTWTYTLLPRRTGVLTVPALELGGEKTVPVNVSVLPEQTTRAPGEREVYIETEIDQTQGYVQQQFLFTVRLFYANDLIRGELDHPDQSNALFRQIGKQKEFSSYTNGRHYRVVERSYAIFPSEPGKLDIPALKFSGTFLEPRTGRRFSRQAASEAVAITINPPPAEFTGRLWIPAQGYILQEEWSSSTTEIPLGETLTRSINQQALGLEGVNFPPIPEPVIDGLKFYTEPAHTATDDTAVGITGTRKDVQMIVATRPGMYEIPEISVPWWDVVNDKQRIATLPARTIRVSGNGQQAVISPLTARDDLTNGPASSDRQPLTDLDPSVKNITPNSLPAWLIGIVLAGWLLTGLGWFLHSRRWLPRKTAISGPVDQKTPQHTLSALKQAAKRDPLCLGTAFPLWLRHEKEGGRWCGASDESAEESIRPLVNKIQALRFGDTASECNNRRTKNDTERVKDEAGRLAQALITLLEERMKEKLHQKKSRTDVLPDIFMP
jgi:hypothetical protein